jgi:hypothetical protein
MVIDDQIKIEADLQKRMGKEAAAEWTNRYGNWFGVDPGARSRPRQQPQTEEEKKQAEYIADQSTKIAVEWAKVLDSVSKIKTEFLAWGLPHVLTVVEKIATAFGKISEGMDKAKKDDPGHQFVPNKSIFGRMLNWDWSAGPGVKSPPAAPDAAKPEAAPAAPPNGLGHLRRIPPLGHHPSSYEGANDNRSLLHNASFGGSDVGGSSGEGRAQAIIKGGVYEALIEFATYMRTGGTGGTGGVSLASFGGSAGAAGGGRAPGAAGFGGGGYRNLGSGPNAAGRAGIPGSAAETSSEAVTAAQGGSDLDRSAFDKMFKGTPMEGKYDKVVESAKANNIPPSLMAGVIAHETGMGTSAMLRDRNNPAGLMNPKTGMRTGQSFPSVDAGIEAAGKSIAKNYTAGGGTIEGMSKSYAPVGAANDPRGLNSGWAAGVTKFQSQLAAKGASATGYTGVGGYNFMGSDRARAMGMGDVQQYGANAQIDFPTGIPKGQGPASIKANKYAGTDMAGFLKDLHDAGAPLDQFAGAYVPKPRQHGYGNALDIETGFGSGPDNSPKLYAWAQAHPKEFAEIQARHHMRNLDTSSGANMHDWGHFEWTPTGKDTAVADRSALSKPLDRSALNDNNKIHSTGKLDVSVNAPPGTKVNYHGQNLLKNTSMQRQTQMMQTQGGPTVADTAQSYMRGGT